MAVSDGFTPILCVTRDEQGAVAATVATLIMVLHSLGRKTHYQQNGGIGYAQSRTNLFDSARELYKRDHVRGFLLDDDIRCLDGDALIKCIRYADRQDIDFVGAYRTKSGHFSILEPRSSEGDKWTAAMLGEADIVKYRAWDEVKLSGLGFFYGDIDLTYRFREGNPYTGEDLNFFHDRERKPRLAPIYLDHIKQCALPGLKFE